MPAFNRFTWRDFLVFSILIGVIAAMSIPLVAAVKADAERAQAEVTVQDLHSAFRQCQERTGQLLAKSRKTVTQTTPAQPKLEANQAAYVSRSN